MEFINSNIMDYDCGLHKACFEDVELWNDNVAGFIKKSEGIFQYPLKSYVIDIKVHMLMPGQYPCIPNWHRDFVPRIDGKKRIDLVDTAEKMYLMVTSSPFPEFENGKKVVPFQWVEFDQLDLHRGTPSTEFCWRMFIRLAPVTIATPNPITKRSRRHSQVYLDVNNFEW